ncbi:MAG TPA: nucleoside diphosphate kinase regulator [Synergistaceae bacterium]|jgi:regulator of nucleoside diphosphate kinase|nr:MAG: Transcription elongation factor [Synergistales bacterium 53_16]KUL01322.1 MAG: Transcription elongation factor [Synergistales bacterium 54_9]MDK2845801.1 regulator of nucleoside diphosphate kinase [Synergistales bacterium]HAA47335.1 nucleoside diphosphate kinase regulator [Synergistaceae bacterium]MDN5335137.1 regulator of nucleoside diphosphate kinase [Synergistales bacterium]
MIEQKIYITDFDLKRLKKLLQTSSKTGERKNSYLEQLRKEVEKAVVVPSEDIPEDVITMNSTVVLIDLDSMKELVYTLVFPEEADGSSGKISVLAPVGTALLGYKVGDIIEWDVPAGKRRLKVKRILYQPEASEDYSL